MDRRNFLATVGAAATIANTNRAQNRILQDDSFRALRARLADKKPIIWVFTGDSITHGALHTFGWRSYVEHFAERVRFEMRRMNDFVINSGISGDTLKGISDKVDWRVFQFRPDIISLNIGMNDCREAEKGKVFFRQSFEKFLEKVHEQKSLLLLNTPNLIDYRKAPERQALPDYVEMIRDLATRYRLPLVDHYSYWEKETRNSSRLQFWLNDGSIHPNHFGHIVLAQKIFQDLGIFDPSSMTCKLFVP